MTGPTQRQCRHLAVCGIAAFVVGTAACVIGGMVDAAGFARAWLCAYLFWLGVPLAGVTLVMVHDLTGGNWMATARPMLNAAIVTMPLATLAGLPAFVGLPALYSWTHPVATLDNTFYLNAGAFYLRYAIDVALWNGLAAFALWAPRGGGAPIAPALSWLSGVGLIVLAVSASFAAIDWIMSLEPTFWSSIFPMAIGAGWFNTGLALALLAIALTAASRLERDHMADIAAILLATTIFWAYAGFVQFLIIWEENLKFEIPWYLLRLDSGWRVVEVIAALCAFLIPFFALLTAPGKRSRVVAAAVGVLILLGQTAEKWWLVLPQFAAPPAFWLDVAAMLALGGAMLVLFLLGVRFGARLTAPARPLAASHG